MDLANYCVNAVLVEGRSMREVAAATGRSKSWVHRHVALYRAAARRHWCPIVAGAKGAGQPDLCPARGRDRGLRKRLAEDGLDAGARTIAWHLDQSGQRCPGTLHHPPGAAAPRLCHPPAPKASPLELDPLRVRLPNETWQSDMTHWHLEDDQPSRSSTSSTTTRVRRSPAWRCRSPRPRGGAGFLRNCSYVRPTGLSAHR